MKAGESSSLANEDVEYGGEVKVKQVLLLRNFFSCRCIIDVQEEKEDGE